MSSKILDRNEIKLDDSKKKMLISGWGEEVYENTVVEKITYDSDGLKVKGYVAYPKNSSNEKLPCIIWNRGGYKDRGIIDAFNARGIYGQIASWGYIVFTSQYRGNDGSEGAEELGGKDVNDILNLMPLADEFENADKDNWGIEGWSRGGMMTFLTLQKKPEFKCAVLSGAISNIKSIADNDTKAKELYRSIMGEENFEKKLEERSAINFVDKLPEIPYLLIHGLADDTVSPIQSMELSRKFHELDITHRLVLLEKGDHFLKNHRKETERLRRMWFDKYLKST